MRILKDNERAEILFFNNEFYTCVFNLESGLLSYSKMPYLKVQGDSIVFDVDKFNGDLKRIGEYDISEEIRFVRDPSSYCTFVQELAGFQYCSFQMNALKDFLKRNPIFDENTIKQIEDFSKLVEKTVDANEQVFKNQIVKQVPNNWSYAMFSESSWTAYEYYVDLHRFANGQVDFPANSIGKTLGDINGYSRENKEREMRIFDGLNKQIVAKAKVNKEKVS